MMNVVAVAPAGPAGLGVGVSPLGKDGGGHLGGRPFGDMLDGLANAAVVAASNGPASTAAASNVTAAAVPAATSALVVDLSAFATSLPLGAGVGIDAPAKPVPQRDGKTDAPAAPGDPNVPAEPSGLLAALLGVMVPPPLPQNGTTSTVTAPGPGDPPPPASTVDVNAPSATPSNGPAQVLGTAAVRARGARGGAWLGPDAASTAAGSPGAGTATKDIAPAVRMAGTGTVAATAAGTVAVAGAGGPGRIAAPRAADTTSGATATALVDDNQTQAVAAALAAGHPGSAAPAAPAALGASGASTAATDVKQNAPGSRPNSLPNDARPAATDLGVTASGVNAPPVPALSPPGDGRPDGRSRGGLLGDAGAAPAAHAVSAPGVFDAQMRLTTELPAIDHAATVVRPAAGTTASASGAGGGIDGDVPRQIVQAIRLQWSQGVGTARVTLQPDYLGDMSIDIRVDRGAVTAVLDASNASVRQWLEGHEPLLRQSLADQGLTLDRLVVKDEQTPSGTGGDERQKREQGESEPRPRSRRDAQADATFEVVM